ncbi:hypothetical protein JCM10212_007152 [Sporobolomyces blumeae]
MISWLAPTATAAVLVVACLWLFLPTSPTEPPPTLADEVAGASRFESPGPIVASRVDHLDLDGLTVIPVTHLPPLKLYLPLPFTRHALKCSLDISTSEMAFAKLRIATSSFRGRDTTREPLDIKASGIEVKMKGSTGMRIRIGVSERRSKDRRKRADQAKGKRNNEKEWTWRTSGRTEVELHGALAHLRLLLVKADNGEPSMSVVSTSLAPGVIDSLNLVGFWPFGRLVTLTMPYIRSTAFVSYPVGIAGDYLIREAVEGRPVDELLTKLAHFARKHIDGDLYGGIVDDEREAELRTPLDSTSLVPPRPSQPESARTAAGDTDIDQAAPSTSSAPSSTPFRFHAHLLGPTRLHSFRLPDFSPELYRADGKGLRNTLQSLNLLTSEFKLRISDSSLQSITFQSASVAFDPPTHATGIRGGDLVIAVAPLACTLVSSFSLKADVKNPLLSWASGMEALGEQGTSSTTVHSDSLQIRLRLSRARPGRAGAPIVLGIEEDVAALGVKGGKGDEAKALSISDFKSIESRVELGSKLGKKLGEKVVNKLLDGLKTQLAQAASLIIGHFLVDLARERLQNVLDEVDEKLRVEGGLEWGKDDVETVPPPKSAIESVSVVHTAKEATSANAEL